MNEKMIILTEEAFNQLNEKLDLILKCSNENSQRWLNNDDVMEMLDISRSTLQVYRDKQLIPFYQIGRKILYKYADVEKLLEQFRIPSNFH